MIKGMRGQGMRLHIGSAVAVIAILCACGGTSTLTVSNKATSTVAPQPTATAVAVEASVIGIVSTPVAVGASAYGSATASCPAGVPLLSGGYISHYDVNPTGPGPAPTESYPVSATTWKVTVRTFGATAHVTAIAVCLRANFSATVVAVHSFGTGNDASIGCSAGSVLTGGGFQSATAPVVYSQPDGNGWKVEQQFLNQNNGNPTVYALCATQGLVAAPLQQASVPVGANQNATNGAKCPPGQLPVGGGFNGYAPNVDVSWTVWQSEPNLTVPGSSVSSGWVAAVQNLEQSAETFTVYEVCATH